MVYDVAIVGAGPAGSRAAWRLARGGVRVALIDNSHPREKPCGGGVTGRAIRLVADQLGAASSAAGSGTVVQRAVFVAGSARATVDLRCDSFAGASALAIFPRAEFDLLLLEGAVAAGAVHIRMRVRDLDAHGPSPAVLLETGERVRATRVIGADGANSLVRRRVLAPFARAELSVATGYFVRGASSPEIVVEFLSDPPGYLWSFPRADHLAVGVCAQADCATPERLRLIGKHWIERERIEGPLEGYSWPIPSLSSPAIRRQQPAGDWWLLAGDAAGLVDPITREGIYFALASADFAAEAVLQGGDVRQTYLAALGRDLLPELARAAELKAGFFRPPFMSLLLRALQSSARVRAIMADLVAGEQPYRTLARRLLGTMEYGLAWELLKLRRQRPDPAVAERTGAPRSPRPT